MNVIFFKCDDEGQKYECDAPQVYKFKAPDTGECRQGWMDMTTMTGSDMILTKKERKKVKKDSRPLESAQVSMWRDNHHNVLQRDQGKTMASPREGQEAWKEHEKSQWIHKIHLAQTSFPNPTCKRSE
jgi:hypothetical protein